MREAVRRTPVLITILLLAALCVAAGQVPAPPAPASILYTVDRTSASTIHDRAPSYTPTYLIYADTERTADAARQLVATLGMASHLEQYKARAFVVGPANGSTYDATADLAAFQDLLRTRRSSNLKIIGLGAGATFVNDVIAPRAFAVAGILTYGGTVNPATRSTMPVPAYVHASNPAVGRLFTQANGATSRTESATSTAYANRASGHALERVVVSKLDDARETPAEAFQHAWTMVFSRNYRLYMRLMESYAQGFDPNNFTEPWELEPYVMFDELGMSSEAITEELPGLGLSLRYEYVPARVRAAAPKTIPLVVMLHGNTNDPRIQGESSGWPEVAASNAIILTSIEWQGRTAQGTTFAAIGEKGTFAIIDTLLAKYPQIDPTRVYLTGLSAGAMNSFTYGVSHVDRVAAVEGSSAPFAPPTLLEAADQLKGKSKFLPIYSIAGTKDMYKPLPVNDTPRSFYGVIRAFATINDVHVPDAPDLSVNELFGVRFPEQRWGEVGGTRAMIGTFANRDGVVMKFVGLDPYGHWNFKPAAADIWAFLSRFRRDLMTGQLRTVAAR